MASYTADVLPGGCNMSKEMICGLSSLIKWYEENDTLAFITGKQKHTFSQK